MALLFFGVAFLVVLVAVSVAVEARRRRPEAPATLYWDPTIKIEYAQVDGHRLRFIRTGSGPNLVLLHTLRTQLDIFEKMIPRLSKRFTVHALDYPGHGFSDIPKVDYRPELFVNALEGYLEQGKLEEATLAGISIGGTISLLIAAKGNRRVRKVVAINPYDYAEGRGITRGNFVAWLVMTLARVPVVGETVMRLRNPMVEGQIMAGGVADPATLGPQLMAQLGASGAREGHYVGFLNLIRHAHLWDDAHAVYGKIKVPVLVVYGERDWSRPEERSRTVGEIPGARLVTVPGGGHFLSIDQPERLATLIEEFA